ncbi:unnamed protein product, partial [Urochloa humidicola]
LPPRSGRSLSLSFPTLLPPLPAFSARSPVAPPVPPPPLPHPLPRPPVHHRPPLPLVTLAPAAAELLIRAEERQRRPPERMETEGSSSAVVDPPILPEWTPRSRKRSPPPHQWLAAPAAGGAESPRSRRPEVMDPQKAAPAPPPSSACPDLTAWQARLDGSSMGHAHLRQLELPGQAEGFILNHSCCYTQQDFIVKGNLNLKCLCVVDEADEMLNIWTINSDAQF